MTSPPSGAVELNLHQAKRLKEIPLCVNLELSYEIFCGSGIGRNDATFAGNMKQIEVVAAIIHDADGRIFATQRGYGDFKDFWEFPGGKMEPGESPQEALKREIWEELETRIVIERLVRTIEWDYPAFHLTMHCYWCHVESGELTLKEHEAARWLGRDELRSVEWLPADLQVLDDITRIRT